ncbi:MAG: bifunctional oligoribonuclease/PAP phosphatase NrnA [Fibrobacter sp.]|nr:bifunctional oligoribonuclease/PAP phosphatase NrnA [Fibrobacter sp.]
MIIDELLSEAKTIAIFGHVRPDGDCVGSTLAMWNYTRDNYPNAKVEVFLEDFSKSFNLVRGAKEARKSLESDQVYDLAILMDAPSFERVGANGVNCLKTAKKTLNVDHHISNSLNLCTVNIVEPSASSACEVLFFQLDKDKISKETANCLYMGIVHDTGAFKFSCTSKRTMNAVAELIDKNIDFAKIVNETYSARTYNELRLTGIAMQKSVLLLDGKVLYSYVTQQDMDSCGASVVELGNIIDAVRTVTGTEVTVFIYPINGEYKISLRSNYIVDVNAIAHEFGGGGHVRAAGCNTDDTPDVAIEKILKLVQKQL